MFMRLNSKCAHQVRPPPGRFGWCSAVDNCLATSQDQSLHVATHSEGRVRQPPVYRFESLLPSQLNRSAAPVSDRRVKPTRYALFK
jgi:hypothetical protein